jgi:hypothetical protein
VLLAESEGADTTLPQQTPTAANPNERVADRLSGTIALRNANWKTDSLPTAVQITEATLHLQGGQSVWDPVSFAYGPLKGTAQVTIPVCASEEPCSPTVDVEFPTLDAAEFQSTLLGVDKKGTLLSSVIASLTPSSEHKWPAFEGTVKASSLALGPVMLHDFAAQMKVTAQLAELRSFDAGILGGQVHAAGKVENGAKPAYTLEGTLQKVAPAGLCQVLELTCSGTSIDGDGKIELSGFAGKDLAGSATGSLNFDWKKGAITGRAGAAEAVPQVLARFDEWNGSAVIADGVLTLKDNQVKQGKRTSSVNATVTFGEPPKVIFAAPKGTPGLKK